MLTAIILLVAVPGWSKAQDGETLIPDNKTQCATDMVNWCTKMQYPQEAAGISMESVTYEDPAGEYKVFCSSDSDGTVCTKNTFSWFSCTPTKQNVPPGNTLTYNGQVLTENTPPEIIAGLDDICDDADRAFNDLFIQNMSYENETLQQEAHEDVKAMFQQISDMRDQMEKMQARMDLLSLFFKMEMMGGPDGDGSPLQNETETTTLSPSNSTVFLNTTEQVNEVQVD